MTVDLVILALANFVLCTAIGWAAFCRLNVMGRDTKEVFRLTYTVILVAATASGFSPLLFREWPGIAQTLMSAAVFVVLWSGLRKWKLGPPEYARKGGP